MEEVEAFPDAVIRRALGTCARTLRIAGIQGNLVSGGINVDVANALGEKLFTASYILEDADDIFTQIPTRANERGNPWPRLNKVIR